jgi:tRNA G10  N-methylase Trm11
MEYLIRFAQVHESFRRPELQALATMAGVDFEIVSYNQYVRFPGPLFPFFNAIPGPETLLSHGPYWY